jgi:hypothetical protein
MVPMATPLPSRPAAGSWLERGLPPALFFALCAMAWGIPAFAQSERYLLKPGSNVGPATRIRPTNCRTAADGSVTCDTVIENDPSDTPAKPEISPFRN